MHCSVLTHSRFIRCLQTLTHAGVFVHSIATGADIGHDTLGGYFGNLNEQVHPSVN